MSDPLHATDQRLGDRLIAAGALQHRHVLLQSGHHGDQHLDLSVLLQQGVVIAQVAQVLTSQSRAIVGAMGSAIDLVVAARAEVLPVAEELGRALGVPSLDAGDGFGADVPPRARVLLVSGDLEIGDPIHLLLPKLYAVGAHPIAAAVVARRTPRLTEIEADGRDPIPLIAAITLNLPTYEPDHCPLCAAGEPIVAS